MREGDKWVDREEKKEKMGQRFFRVADISLVYSPLSHFLEPVLWLLKLGAQGSQLTQVCLPGNKRTFINIQSTFHNLVFLSTFCGFKTKNQNL